MGFCTSPELVQTASRSRYARVRPRSDRDRQPEKRKVGGLTCPDLLTLGSLSCEDVIEGPLLSGHALTSVDLRAPWVTVLGAGRVQILPWERWSGCTSPTITILSEPKPRSTSWTSTLIPIIGYLSDPRAIRLQHGDLQEGCVACLVSFFTEVLDAIKLGNQPKVRDLMRYLGEPNETHLGFSRGRCRGRGLRGSKTDDIANAISESRAAKTGLLRDLEDTAFLVPGVNKDLLSDMTTQIIRGPLIEYTQQCCRQYDIPMEAQYGGIAWESRLTRVGGSLRLFCLPSISLLPSFH